MLQPIVEVRRPARLRTLLLAAIAAASAVTMTLFLISMRSQSCPYEATAKPPTRIVAPAPTVPPPVTHAAKPLVQQAAEPLAKLDADEIEAQSRASAQAFQRCYQRARKADASLADLRLTVTMTITGAGHVTNVQLSAHDGDSLGRCITTTVGAWQFGWSAGGTFRFNLQFE